MAAGDVEVRIVEAVADTIDTNLTAMRVTAGANGKYMIAALDTIPAQVVLVAITEA